MSARDVVPAAWTRFDRDAYGDMQPRECGEWVRNDDAQATVDQLRARIDELEAQLFITKADAALPLFDAMGLEPMPAFPSIRAA